MVPAATHSKTRLLEVHEKEHSRIIWMRGGRVRLRNTRRNRDAKWKMVHESALDCKESFMLFRSRTEILFIIMLKLSMQKEYTQKGYFHLLRSNLSRLENQMN